MKMYSKGSSFQANLTLIQTDDINCREVSFSCYLNKSEENMIRELANQASKPINSDKDDEIGVFGAEKYFKGEIQDRGNKNDLRITDTNNIGSKMDDKFKELGHSFPANLRAAQTNMHTDSPSVPSSVSGNSRTGLFCRAKQPPGSKTRTFLARFGCNCINKKSTQINEKENSKLDRLFIRILDSNKETGQVSSKFTGVKAKDDRFSFPVTSSNETNSNASSNLISNSKSGNLAGKVQGDNNNDRLSLGKKLSLLNDWDVDIPNENEKYIKSSGTYNNDADSDSSSDLFEIESFSPTHDDGSYSAHRKSEFNAYPPSEVSIDWSVVTASAADFSVVSDYESVRTGGGGRRDSGRNHQVRGKKDEPKKRAGILSGCASYKAVRVA